MGAKLMMIPSSKPYLATLFASVTQRSPATDAGALLRETAIKANALRLDVARATTARAPVKPAPDLPSGSLPAEQQPAWVQAGRDSIAASEAAFAQWESGEQNLAAKNGFRREANSMILGMYAKAQTGQFGTAAITTRKDMNDHLDRFISGFIRDVALINQSGGSLTVGAADQSVPPKGLDPAATAIAQAKAQDHLDTRRMTLFAETAYVRKSLGLSQPVVTQSDGLVSFTEQDIALNGTPFARISADGSLTLLAQNTDPAHPDPADLYTTHVNRYV